MPHQILQCVTLTSLSELRKGPRPASQRPATPGGRLIARRRPRAGTGRLTARLHVSQLAISPHARTRGQGNAQRSPPAQRVSCQTEGEKKAGMELRVCMSAVPEPEEQQCKVRPECSPPTWPSLHPRQGTHTCSGWALSRRQRKADPHLNSRSVSRILLQSWDPEKHSAHSQQPVRPPSRLQVDYMPAPIIAWVCPPPQGPINGLCHHFPWKLAELFQGTPPRRNAHLSPKVAWVQLGWPEALGTLRHRHQNKTARPINL